MTAGDDTTVLPSTTRCIPASLAEAMTGIRPLYRDVFVSRRFGHPPLAFDEIGRAHGIGHARARRIERTVLSVLERKIGKRALAALLPTCEEPRARRAEPS